MEYITTELKLHNYLEVIKRQVAEKYKNSAVEMWCHRKYETTVVLQHFCLHVSNRTDSVFKNCKHVNAALVIRLNKHFSKKVGNLPAHWNHFPFCVGTLGNTGKYNMRVFLQPFRIKVLGSFFSVSAPPLIPKGRESHSNHNNRTFVIQHHSTQGTLGCPMCLKWANSQGMPPSCTAVVAQALYQETL